MSHRTGYYINVAKMKPEEDRSFWEREHGTGFQHYGTIECNNRQDPHDQFVDALKRYPREEGYTLSLMYYPGIVHTLLSTHVEINGHSIEASTLPEGELPNGWELSPEDGRNTFYRKQTRPYYG
ncbi:hypothetical protein EVB27_076 [Rhizobium phage RHph_TM16]|nr:hypothetical protein EVB27_076 [Rhizobium phage RHph_TM16]